MTDQPGPALAAGIIALSPFGRVLMCKRTDGEGWAFPGGGIKDGEDAKAAAVREFLEETGYRIGTAGKLHMRRVRNGVDFSTFIRAVDEEFVPKLNHEHSSWGWFFPKEVLAEGSPAPMPAAPPVMADSGDMVAFKSGLVNDRADEFVESEHPRGEGAKGGQFVRKGEGGGGGAEPGPKEKGGEEPPASKGQASQLFEAHPSTGKSAADIIAAHPGMAEKIAKVKEKLAQGTPTDHLHKKDGKYTPEREALHNKIIREILSPKAMAAATPKAGEKPTVTFLGGRGGSGKGWLTKPGQGPVDATKAIVLNSDDVQEKFPEYQGWNAAHTHDEAAEIVEQAEDVARKAGLNVILDATMRSEGGIRKKLERFQKAGYDVHGHYMFLPPEEAAKRALGRFDRGGEKGRYVPPEYTLGSTENEKNFDKMTPSFKKWSIYHNLGESPELVKEGGA